MVSCFNVVVGWSSSLVTYDLGLYPFFEIYELLTRTILCLLPPESFYLTFTYLPLILHSEPDVLLSFYLEVLCPFLAFLPFLCYSS